MRRSLFNRIAFVVTFLTLSVSMLNVASADEIPTSLSQDHQSITEVRVGAVPVMIFAPLFVADANGYFADENLLVDVESVVGGSEPLAPLASGELDVVFGGAGAGLFNYASRNMDLNSDPGFRIVAGGHTEKEPLTSPLVVSKARYDSGEITSVADLAGRRVSINATGAATEYWLVQAMESNGLSMEDIDVVSVAFPDVPAALNSDSADRIDAAILGEPLVSFAEQQGLVVRLADDFVDGFQATFVYMSTDFIENNREAALGFIRAYVRASRYLADNATWASDEVATVLETYTSVPAEINKTASRPYFPLNGEIHVDDLVALQDYFFSQEGTLAYDELLDVNAMLDASLLEEVIADIGEVEDPDAEEANPEAEISSEAGS